ncbi:hypothetical protein E4U44_006765 [Claviceps purpurea]|nr:hypothetical protein E4U44_006765 [Claviceps purpurea]
MLKVSNRHAKLAAAKRPKDPKKSGAHRLLLWFAARSPAGDCIHLRPEVRTRTPSPNFSTDSRLPKSSQPDPSPTHTTASSTTRRNTIARVQVLRFLRAGQHH